MRRFIPFHPWQRAAAMAFAFVALHGSSRAQSPTWIHQAPEPASGWNRSVQMLSASEAWVVQDTSAMHTTDGGKSWTQANVKSTSMWALYFVDPQHGWLAGNGFWHTTNGGQTWIQDNNWGSIYGLYFIDTQRGWACGNGGTTYRTTNGGLSWSYATVPGTITTLRSIHFVDALTGWTINIDGDIFKSTDGGQSWTLNLASGASNLCSVQFTSGLEGWAIGGKTFLHTLDGGQSWAAASVPAGTWAYDAWFSDRFHGWAVGEGGFGVRTLDAGQTWLPFATPGPRLWSVHFKGTQTGMSVGEGGALNLSTDGGQTWSSLISGGSGTTHALDVFDANHAWAANSEGEILYTTDGAFWNRVPVSGFDVYGSINDIDFADLSNGWAVGEHKYFGGQLGQIVHSGDGGKTWTVQASYPGAYMDAVVAVNTQTVYAFGGGSAVWKTTNGGSSWVSVAASTGATQAAHFLDAQTGWAVGGVIRKTTDGGQSWVLQHSPPDFLYGVSFADAQAGWAVGWSGTLLRTVDGGQTWTQQNPGTSQVLFGVHALDAQTAWIAGGGGFVARTKDGGQTWIPEALPNSSGVVLETVAFLDPDYGWVGGYGGIWRRDAGGLPCAPAPSSYCTAKPNSAGGLAQVSWSGSPSASAGNFVLQLSGGLPGKHGGAFFSATSAASFPFLNGTLCTQPPVIRLPLHLLNSKGATSYPIAVQPAWVGTQRWYQFWYRDGAHPDGTGISLSDALEVTFCE